MVVTVLYKKIYIFLVTIKPGPNEKTSFALKIDTTFIVIELVVIGI